MNDVKNVHELITTKFGYPDSDIRVIHDALPVSFSFFLIFFSFYQFFGSLL